MVDGVEWLMIERCERCELMKDWLCVLMWASEGKLRTYLSVCPYKNLDTCVSRLAKEPLLAE